MKEIEISVNGERRRVPEPLTMLALLEQLGINPALIVIERQQVIYTVANFHSTPVLDQDQLEIVRFMGGG